MEIQSPGLLMREGLPGAEHADCKCRMRRGILFIERCLVCMSGIVGGWNLDGIPNSIVRMGLPGGMPTRATNPIRAEVFAMSASRCEILLTVSSPSQSAFPRCSVHAPVSLCANFGRLMGISLTSFHRPLRGQFFSPFHGGQSECKNGLGTATIVAHWLLHHKCPKQTSPIGSSD